MCSKRQENDTYICSLREKKYSRRFANSLNGERLDGSPLEIVLATAQLHREVVILVPHTIHLGSHNDKGMMRIRGGGGKVEGRTVLIIGLRLFIVRLCLCLRLLFFLCVCRWIRALFSFSFALSRFLLLLLSHVLPLSLLFSTKQ